jgi:hypothetical protein
MMYQSIIDELSCFPGFFQIINFEFFTSYDNLNVAKGTVLGTAPVCIISGTSGQLCTNTNLPLATWMTLT